MNKNQTEFRMEKLRKVKNYLALFVTVSMTIIIGWLFIRYILPRHWAVVNGKLREVISGFDEFDMYTWMGLIYGLIGLAILWGLFTLSLKFPLGAGALWSILFCVLVFITVHLFVSFFRYYDFFTGVSAGSILVIGIFVLLLAILNLIFGFRRL
jgi:hypothetical protein